MPVPARVEVGSFYSALLELPGPVATRTGSLLAHLARTSDLLENVTRASTPLERELAAISLYWAQRFFEQGGGSKVLARLGEAVRDVVRGRRAVLPGVGRPTDSTQKAEVVASLRTMSRAADKVAIRVRIIWSLPAS